MAEREYERLTRWRRGGGKFFDSLSTHSSLWLGQDHLLIINSRRFREHYKRFYFRDIQAITIRKTKRREIWNLILALVLLLAIGILVSTSAGAYAWALSLLILGLPLFLNNILGPTCTVYVRTAVQTEEVPSLARIRRTQKVLTRVRPLIAATQGQLGPQETSINSGDEASAPDTAVPTTIGAVPPNLPS